METLLTDKTISVTKLREPRKVIDKAGSQPVAVLNRSNVVGYFVPASAVEKLDFSACETDEVMSALHTLDPKALAQHYDNINQRFNDLTTLMNKRIDDISAKTKQAA